MNRSVSRGKAFIVEGYDVRDLQEKEAGIEAVGALLASWLRMRRQGRVYERELSAAALSDSKALRRWIAANAGSEFAEQAEWCLRNNGTVEQEVLIRGWSEDRLRELVAPR